MVRVVEVVFPAFDEAHVGLGLDSLPLVVERVIHVLESEVADARVHLHRRVSEPEREIEAVFLRLEGNVIVILHQGLFHDGRTSALEEVDCDRGGVSDKDDDQYEGDRGAEGRFESVFAVPGEA